MKIMCKILIKVFVCFCLFLFIGCEDNTVCTIPIKIDRESGQIFLPVTFNGKTNEFLFDTGCSVTRIKKYNDIEKENRTEFALFKFDYDTIVWRYPKGKFDLGLFSVEAPFVVYDEGKNILGMNIISQYYWYFDLEKEVVHISIFPITELGKESFGLNFYEQDNDRTILVKLMPNPNMQLNMLFDTGAGIKPGLFLFQHGDSIRSEEWKINSSDLFYQRNSDNWVWMSDSLKVGKYTLNHLLFIFDSDEQRIKRFNERGIEGLITMSFVNRFKKFYMDPKAKKIFFYEDNVEKNRALGEYFIHVKSMFKQMNK